LTEGGISPLEKALEWGKEFSTALITMAATIDEEGIAELEAYEDDAYVDQAVKWGDKTIYVEKDRPQNYVSPEAIVEETNRKFEQSHKHEAVARKNNEDIAKLSVAQQRALKELEELAKSDPMQAKLLEKQLNELNEKGGDDSTIIPELRAMQNKELPQSDSKSAVDLLEMARNNSHLNHGTVPLSNYNPTVEFEKQFDRLASSMIQFVRVAVDGIVQEDKVRNINVALKSIVMALQDLFKIFHPFVGTKYHPAEKKNLLRTGSELQLAVKNLVQAVKGRINALPQFADRATQTLNYYTQVFVDAMWNLHVASEIVSVDVLESECREYSVSISF
jgi:hypothetical protein